MNGRAGTRAQGQGTRNRGCGVSRFKWRKDLSLSGMWAGRKIWATRRRFTNCRSGDVHDDSQLCVALFLLNRYWGIVTVPGSIPYGSRPGMAGSSPSTLTTSLVIPVPSSSSSNGPSNYSVDNHGLVPWRLRRLGRSKVRSASLVRVLSDENSQRPHGP